VTDEHVTIFGDFECTWQRCQDSQGLR